MPKRTLCRLRTHRRHSGLSQQELAFILGYRNSAQLSRMERGLCLPDPGAALLCELLFSSPHREIFPRLFDHVEEELMRRIYELHERLTKSDRSSAIRKLQFLKGCLKRAMHNKNIKRSL